MPDILQIRKPSGDIQIIGDVHGEFGAFTEVVSQIKQEDILIIAGDLIDRGTDSAGTPTTANVLDMIISENEESIAAGRGQKIYAIKGNHEDMFLNAMAEIQAEEAGTGRATINFLENGGDWIFASQQNRARLKSVIAAFRKNTEPTAAEKEAYNTAMEGFFNIIKEGYREQYINKTLNRRAKLIKKLDIYRQYINDLPSIIKVDDMDPLLVGHSEIVLSDDVIDEKI